MRAELSWRGRTGELLVDGAPAAVLHRAPPDGTPADAAAFVLWMVDLFGRRQERPAATAAAGGATAGSSG